MAYENFWPQYSANMSATGTTGGYVTVASTTGLYVRQKVVLSGATSLTGVIKEVLSATVARVGPDDGVYPGAGYDLSLFTPTATIFAPFQQIQYRGNSNPLQVVYEAEPTKALRMMSVDPQGNYVSPGSVSISGNISVTISSTDVLSVTFTNPLSVTVNNFPTSITVNNFPTVQTVNGSVTVGNFPTSITVNNFPTSITVNNSSFTVNNFPTSITVNNSSFTVNNFPTSFTVNNSSFTVNNFPTSITVNNSSFTVNFPTSITVNNSSFTVNNFPTVQTVNGSVTLTVIAAATFQYFKVSNSTITVGNATITSAYTVGTLSAAGRIFSAISNLDSGVGLSFNGSQFSELNSGESLSFDLASNGRVINTSTTIGVWNISTTSTTGSIRFQIMS